VDASPTASTAESGEEPRAAASSAIAVKSPDADRPLRRGVVLLQLPLGVRGMGETEGAPPVWSPPLRGVRSAYVCRSLPCVTLALRRKLLTKRLGGALPPAIAQALQAAAGAEAVLPAGALLPGLTERRAAELRALMPQVAPLPPGELRGGHDMWTGPPMGPK
jgi:hypothetical protein